jgi:DeoR/GlpR family transcriptional regulator of sugar metabolism
MATKERPYTQAARILLIEDLVRHHAPVTVERLVALLNGPCIRTVHRDIRFLESRNRVSYDRDASLVILRRRDHSGQ